LKNNGLNAAVQRVKNTIAGHLQIREDKTGFEARDLETCIF
jgi:hypothetical protein